MSHRTCLPKFVGRDGRSASCRDIGKDRRVLDESCEEQDV
jgi:hypothetical protein